MSGFGAGFRTALQAMFADPAARAVMIGAVLLYSFFYPAAYRHQVASDLPIAVVDADHSASSRELIRHVDALLAVRVVSQPADLAQAKQQLLRGEVDGIVLIPQRLDQARNSHDVAVSDFLRQPRHQRYFTGLNPRPLAEIVMQLPVDNVKQNGAQQR